MLLLIFLMNHAKIFALVKQRAENLVYDILVGEFVDLQPLLLKFTIDTTTILLFGKDFLQVRLTTAFTTTRPEAGSQRLFEMLRTCFIVVSA